MRVLSLLLMVAMTTSLPQLSQADANGGTDCAVCTIAIGLIEQLVQINDLPVEKVLDKICDDILPSKIQPLCHELVALFGKDLIEKIEAKETPDRICQDFKFCTGTCRLFPAPTREVTRPPTTPEHLLIKWCDLPVINPICDIINNWANKHDPADDGDKDGYSPIHTARGADWRGKDCDDTDPDVRPGRYPLDSDKEKDSNCNGIYGVDPDTGKPFEDLLCAGTKSMGTVVLGDSASAHFRIPPNWLTAADLNATSFTDLFFALENELDWPMLSATTGFASASSWSNSIQGPSNSTYQVMRNINRCNHRDFQNIAVNGARASSMNDTIMQSLARVPTDKPALVVYALIGNDVCNGHPDTIAHMTTPEAMHASALGTLRYLDGRLPNGSHVAMMGLADGRVLYDMLSKRIHPLGELNKDVNYASVYDFLNCLEVSPCTGWMNSNETLRNATTARAVELSDVLKNITTTETFTNFQASFFPNPIAEAIRIWEAEGKEGWQLIEPTDGFHPSQYAQPLITRVFWEWIATNHPELMPKVNPNNEKIATIFGEQGGY